MDRESDPLTEVLEAFPLSIRFAGRFELTAPWGLAVPKGLGVICASENTRFWLSSAGTGQSTPVVPGEVILLSPGCGHELRDVPASRVVPLREWLNGARAERPFVLAFGGGGTETALLGGVIQFDAARTHPLYSALPSVVHLGRKEGEQLLQLADIIRLINHELLASKPGSRGILNRLVEILLARTVRVHLAQAGGAANGAFRGMLHPVLGAALALIHRQPEKPWTVAELAARATMSRSAFSAAFVNVLGKPPLQYLRERRMQLACRLLGDPSLVLKEIASQVGYDSVSAFSAAFKRFSGAAPGDYRRRETPSDLT